MVALRAQMNPHFIFNCLNSINRFVITQKPEIAADYLTKFAKLMRMVLERSATPFIPLDEELDMLKLYIDLEAIRFERPFAYEINSLRFNPSSVLIPTLLIQYTGDCSVFPSDVQGALASLSAEDVTHEQIRCDHFAQPLAKAELGQRVVRIDQMGAFSCRRVNGSLRLSHSSSSWHQQQGRRVRQRQLRIGGRHSQQCACRRPRQRRICRRPDGRVGWQQPDRYCLRRPCYPN